MENLLILINRYIFGYSIRSDKETVETVKNMLFFIIENSIKMNKSTMTFKVLIYFLKNCFNLFVSFLKDEKNKDRKEFIKELYKIININKISESLKLDKEEVKKELNVTVFIKMTNKKSVKFSCKIYYILLLFFREYQNDKNIKEKLNKYIKEKDIKAFYDEYDKMILQEKYDSLKKVIDEVVSNIKKDKTMKDNKEKKKLKFQIK